MRLTEIERRLIPALQLDATASLSALAKKLKTKNYKLQYALRRLCERKILRMVPFIDRSALGYSDYHVFFSLQDSQDRRRSRLLEQLEQKSGVVFIAELGGDYQYEMIFSAQSPREVAELIDWINSNFGRSLQHKEVSVSIAYALSPKKYLDPEADHKQILLNEHTLGKVVLDSLNHRILAEISQHEMNSMRETAKRLDLPYATLHSRLQWLREKLVLRAMAYDVEPLNYDYQDYILLLYTRGVEQKLSQKLFEYCRTHPSISYSIALLGQWDYELGIDVAKPELIVPIVQELTEKFSDYITHTRLLLRFRARYFNPYPF